MFDDKADRTTEQDKEPQGLSFLAFSLRHHAVSGVRTDLESLFLLCGVRKAQSIHWFQWGILNGTPCHADKRSVKFESVV